MQYSVNMLAHFRAINECLSKFGGRAELNVETLRLEIRARGRRIELEPQFIFIHEGSLAYTPQLVPQVLDFSGWRGYFNRVWPLATDKLNFKEFCKTHRIRTPKTWSKPGDVSANAIIKRSRSSFAQGITSPLTPAMIQSGNYALAAGDFFEEFIEGKIVKVWYWNELPVCLDIVAMPSVVGDGKRRLRQLIDKIRQPIIAGDWQMWDAIARFQGLNLDSVVPQGQKVIVDFRYLSAAHPVSLDNRNCIESYAASPLLRELSETGRTFWQGIPENFRENVIYSIDGILDDRNQLWYLEMNCNPIVHPDLYLPMLESYFGAAASDTHALAPGGRATAAQAG